MVNMYMHVHVHVVSCHTFVHGILHNMVKHVHVYACDWLKVCVVCVHVHVDLHLVELEACLQTNDEPLPRDVR